METPVHGPACTIVIMTEIFKAPALVLKELNKQNIKHMMYIVTEFVYQVYKQLTHVHIEHGFKCNMIRIKR